MPIAYCLLPIAYCLFFHHPAFYFQKLKYIYLINNKQKPIMSYRNILSVLAICWLAINAVGQSVTVLTYNIRLDNPGDGPNIWPIRKYWLCEQISSANPGIFGTQEALLNQVKYIDSSFTAFRHIGVGREDGKTKGEFSAIWYNLKKFRMVRHGTFWLSATPEKPSVGWDAALPRICTYGLFRDIFSGRQFWVFNTHFDHIGKEARKNSATLILQKIDTFNKAGFPVILMGDFNSDPESDPFKIITRQLQDAKFAEKRSSKGPEGTFNNFDSRKPAVERIDFIFTGLGAGAENYNVIRESRNGRYASDHFPVIAEISFIH
jgi:endonuclease/exonuclease/phosphatase family metal-dependent hydrolase